MDSPNSQRDGQPGTGGSRNEVGCTEVQSELSPEHKWGPRHARRFHGPALCVIGLLIAASGIVLVAAIVEKPVYHKIAIPGIGVKRTGVEVLYPDSLRAVMPTAAGGDSDTPHTILLIPRGPGRLQRFIDRYILHTPIEQRTNWPITIQFILLQKEPNRDAEIERFRETIGGSLRHGETFEMKSRSYLSGPALEFEIKSSRNRRHWIVLYPPAGNAYEPIEVVVRYSSAQAPPERQQHEIDDVVSRIKLVQGK